MEERNLAEAEERSLQIKERIKDFCRSHGQLKSVQKSLKVVLNNVMVDTDHKLAYCRLAKVMLLLSRAVCMQPLTYQLHP